MQNNLLIYELRNGNNYRTRRNIALFRNTTDNCVSVLFEISMSNAKKHLELKNKPTPILDYLFAYVATQYHLFADKLTEYQLNLPREIRKEELTKNRKQKKPFRMKDPFQVSQCRQN